MQNETHYVQEDTVDLKELFAILKKRKRSIWLLTAFFTIFAFVYVYLLAKPVYEVKSMIEVGQIDAQPIDDIINVKQKLSYEYKIDAKGVKRELPRVESISVPKKSSTILSLTISGYSNQEATDFIEQVISKIETEYKEKTNAYINNQKAMLTLVHEDIKSNLEMYNKLQNKLNEYNQKIVSLKGEDAALAGIYAMQIGQQQAQLLELSKYISQLKADEQALKLSLTSVMLKPTHIVGDVEVLDKPVKPKKALIIIVAFITGLMLSVFLAFFLEFVQGEKKED